MTFQDKVGSFASGTGAVSSTVVVSNVGFQPKAILFWWSGRSEGIDTIGRASHQRGFGMAVSATDRRAICSRSSDAAVSSNTDRAHSNAAAIITVSSGSNIDGALDVQSMDAGGFTLVVDDQMPQDLRIHYRALGGDSLTDVATGQFQEPGATGDQDITSLSFQPDCVLFSSIAFLGAGPPEGTSGSLI